MGRDTTLLREVLDKTASRIVTELTNEPAVEAELRSTLGTTYLKMGDWAKAETMQRDALHLRRELFGETNELVATALNDLARAILPSKPSEGETLARQVLALRITLLGEDHPDVAISYYVLASALLWQGKYSEAERMYRQALTMQKKLFATSTRTSPARCRIWL